MFHQSYYLNYNLWRFVFLLLLYLSLIMKAQKNLSHWYVFHKVIYYITAIIYIWKTRQLILVVWISLTLKLIDIPPNLCRFCVHRRCSWDFSASIFPPFWWQGRRYASARVRIIYWIYYLISVMLFNISVSTTVMWMWNVSYDQHVYKFNNGQWGRGWGRGGRIGRGRGRR